MSNLPFVFCVLLKKVPFPRMPNMSTNHFRESRPRAIFSHCVDATLLWLVNVCVHSYLDRWGSQIGILLPPPPPTSICFVGLKSISHKSIRECGFVTCKEIFPLGLMALSAQGDCYAVRTIKFYYSGEKRFVFKAEQNWQPGSFSVADLLIKGATQEFTIKVRERHWEKILCSYSKEQRMWRKIPNCADMEWDLSVLFSELDGCEWEKVWISNSTTFSTCVPFQHVPFFFICKWKTWLFLCSNIPSCLFLSNVSILP